MYRYLSELLARKGITPGNAAGALGLSESRFRELLHEGGFSVKEAFLLRNRFFPEYDVSVLFQRE